MHTVNTAETRKKKIKKIKTEGKTALMFSKVI